MNVVIAQSGGPTAVINASLLGVYKQARQWGEVDTVYGSLNGIEGIIYDRLVSLNEQLATEEQQALLRQTPAAGLRSCRYKLPSFEKDPAVYEQIRATLEKYDIGAFFYIGGNDSMDTVDKLSTYFASVGCPIRVMGVPKTIDNDLMLTDHTPGYGSAAKFVATTVWEIIRDATVYELDSVLIVEIMGRDTGWLTASAALPHLFGEAAPHLVYLPEVAFSAEQFIEDVKRVQKQSRTVIVAVSEGVEVESLSAYQSGKVDNFGHKYLSGVGKCLEDLVKEKIGCKVRSVELNILQRCAAHIASATDVAEAEQLGATAVAAAAQGHTGEMAAIQRGVGEYNPTYTTVPVCEVANKVKYVPREWINEQGNNMLPAALEYILPLIQGEPATITENGLPKHWIVK
ncbi:MAG: 6-phosphofructokinase [Clostridia bacterium]|nr:6-phosphofructokinase [Clostridia bacterium]